MGITRKKDRACVVRWQRQWGYIYFCDMVFFRCFLYIGYLSMLLVCLLCLVRGRCLLIRRLHAIFRTQQHPIWPTMLSPFGQTCGFIIPCDHSADSFLSNRRNVLILSVDVHTRFRFICFVRSKYTYFYF